MIDLNLQGDKVQRANNKIERAIGELEYQIEKRKYDAYSIENRETIKSLDKMLKEKQTELDTLSYINSQIEQNELAGLESTLLELMKIKAETI